MKLRLSKFDPDGMKPYRIILLVGKRGTGKSVLLNDLMYYLSRKVDYAVAMTPTEETRREFRAHMPESWIYDNFNGPKVDQLLALQRDAAKRDKLRKILLVLDDCMYDKKVLKNIGIRDIFMNGRHLYLTFTVAMQYVMDMTPDLRTQVDYVFALRENIISNKQKLWKYFFGMFERFEDFSRVMDKCTSDHGCIVLDNTAQSNNVQDSIFWYKANINPPPYKIGKEVFWRMHEQMKKSPEDAASEAQDQMRMVCIAEKERRRKQPILNIERADERGKVLRDDEDVTLEIA